MKRHIFLLITIMVLNIWAVFAAGTSIFGSDAGLIPGPLTVDPDFRPRSGTYYYAVDFNGLNIGTASIAIDHDADLFKVKVQARTIGMADRLYRMRYRGEALMDTAPLSSVKTTMQQDVRSTEKVTTMSFQDNGAIKTTETKSENGSPMKYAVRNVQTERFTLDPFSATYLVRGLDWAVGTEKVFDVYPGKYQYELRLKCVNTAIVEFGGEKRTAWVIVPTVTNLDPDKQSDAAKKKPANVKIYVSADELKDVLKIEASHTLGQFRVRMERFEPAGIQAKAEVAPAKEAEIPVGEAAIPAGN
jgi:hypothetical protein